MSIPTYVCTYIGRLSLDEPLTVPTYVRMYISTIRTSILVLLTCAGGSALGGCITGLNPTPMTGLGTQRC